MTPKIYEACRKIRTTEESLLELFAKGKMNGTIHTCVGQELASYYLIRALKSSDTIFSNHRCHGHFLHRFDDHNSLIAELMGKKSGVCSGIGSSQHICREGFFSNGVQGGIVPLAAGIALSNKLRGQTNIVAVFIGDGTLGEGVVYETFNIAALFNLPLLVVCEDNGYAQSTKKDSAFRGSIPSRCEGFGLKYLHASMWEEEELEAVSIRAVEQVRSEVEPVFLHIDTYRLNSHSKSDDNREKSDIEKYRQVDPLVLYSERNPDACRSIDQKLYDVISESINRISKESELSFDEYIEDHFAQRDPVSVSIGQKLTTTQLLPEEKVVRRINDFFNDLMENDNRVVFVGEDVADPYGGAFKISSGLSTKYPDRVFSTPISEQGITGLANGLAMSGMRPYLEIMFGDFVPLIFDQLINHASKFYYMYDKQVTCPIVIRTPVGGGRGYGPTHSQAIEKLVVGLDNIRVVAIDAFRDPYLTYSEIHQSAHPVMVIENKAGYGRYLHLSRPAHYRVQIANTFLGNSRVSPEQDDPVVTVVSYGESASRVVDALDRLFEEHEIIVDLHVLTSLFPFKLENVIESATKTKKILVVEESSLPFGIGAEICASINERAQDITVKRLGAIDIPIPSIRSLEQDVLRYNELENSLLELIDDNF